MSLEQTPLLSIGEYAPRRSLYSKILTLLRPEDEPSWLVSFRWFFLGSWLNTLLLFVPVAATAHCLNWEAPLRFGLCFVSIISLAKVRIYMMAAFQTHVLIQICSQLSGDAIEQISLSVGHTLAGLLNASLGNIIEIIVGITALLQGEFQIVQTAVCSLPSCTAADAYRTQMLGSILYNIVFVLGCSFVAGTCS
jgi:Ca2+:H+ antiporter